MSEALYGFYRGYIAATDDKQKRGRCRVRVPVIHSETIPVANLPWAEVITTHGGKKFGDLPAYEPGDTVCVIFEGGSASHPAILGTWVTNSLGIADRVPENTTDYDTNRRRWLRTDRAGNTLELCDTADGIYARIASGNAQVTVSMVDNSISIEARGPVRVVSPQVVVDSGQTFVVGDDVTIQAKSADGSFNVYSNGTVNIWAQSQITTGQYVDAMGIPHQTVLEQHGPKALALGMVGVIMPTQTIDVKSTQVINQQSLVVNINGSQAVNVNSNGPVAITSATQIAFHAPSISFVRLHGGGNPKITFVVDSCEIQTRTFNIKGLP